ncbi:MAG TPA: protein kinase, partial [Pyrinomonadaceae bacterium]|nr:protein kinase [Pyrinomonadaceae bacterium]
MVLASGTKLGRYEIRSKIGEGGMGEVYLAQDTSELGRTVALKIVSAEVAKDKDRLQRFTQEARTVSNLNHPNILTIHEFGQTESVSFIATEFVDGLTLRAHLANRRLKLIDVLDVAIQIVGALNAAHEAGVTHRDLKPENVMIRKDHIVKVLDFGLAKLAQPPAAASGSTGSEDATRLQVNTTPGLIMGTVSYMSPEQSVGAAVDHRTDIWSAGVVLYEMIAGCVPFQGKDIHRQIIAIQESDPAPLSQQVEGVPERLEEIVLKCLAKEKDERYQTTKDLLIDLRNLRRKLDVDAEIERTVAPALRSTSAGRFASTQSAQVNSGPTASAAQVSTTSSAEYIVTGIKQHKLAVALVIVALAAGGLLLFWYVHTRNTEVAIESIAVLPFENQNHDPDSEYVSDGVTEGIINSLTQLPNLKVIARSSVFRYKGKAVDPLSVGKELGVRAVLTGRIMQRGDTITVSTELVDVRDNKQLWGEQYNEKVSDLISLPRDIASKITSNLSLTISGEEHNRMMKQYTTNSEAYQLYLKGRYYWNKRGADALKQAAQYYDQAIEKDPGYALAYAGLAETYSLYPDYSVEPPKDSYPKSKAAALRALELDNSLAEPHTALGRYYNYWEWNRAEAETQYRRAIELKPNYATAHHWLGDDVLAQLKRFDEALAEGKRATELDPLSPIIAANLGDVLMYARRYDEAIAQYRHSLSLDSNFYYTYASMGICLADKGMYQDAITTLRKGLELNKSDPQLKGYLAYALGKSGHRDEAMKLLDEMKRDSLTAYVPDYWLGVAYIGLNEKDQAFASMIKNADTHDSMAAYYAVDPLLDDLRSDPRFAELLKRVGLTP